MLQHHLPAAAAPKRVVILGAGGFIGGEIAKRLQQQSVPVLALGRGAFSLLDADASDKLATALQPDDALVFVSALAPVRNPAMMVDNIRMAGAVCAAIQKRSIAHLVYISSDAVYADEPRPLNESTPMAPTSLHGVMHLTRELMLEAAAGATPYARLRPTLVYGASDPHNGYGPNRFRRLANRGEPILLFGEGEERRDHVAVTDIAELTARVLSRRSSGALNIATGGVISFREAAELAVRLAKKDVPVQGQPRAGGMPHGGHRPFDPAATAAAFPDFRYLPVAEGMARAQETEFGNG
jgi:nucleoside-diphosphate-sugar epimerase